MRPSSIDDFIIIIIVFSILVIPVILTIMNLLNSFLKRKIMPNIVDGLIMVLGTVLTFLLFSSWQAKDYNVALRVPVDFKWHSPIASSHMPTIIVLSILGLTAYLILRKFKLKMPPLVIVICISFMIIGCVLSVAWILQLSSHIFDYGENMQFEVLFLCLFPFNYIICSISVAKIVIKEYVVEQDNYYKNPILNICNLVLQNSKNWPVTAIVLTIPILIITLFILVLFGQHPSAIIKAFTETSDWLLSRKISPPPIIDNSGHYLCTVSLRGHCGIVKPLRYGIRGKEKIVVNRQLCIANAFEQLLQERTPEAHRIIRNIYDKYGYPLSKHIRNPVSADLVYIIMKPLEWFFLVILYLFDINPEDRIAKQYLPLHKLSM